MADKDVRVVLRVRNARVLRMMEDLGIETVAELSRRSGVNQVELGRLINMKEAALLPKRGGWRVAVVRLSEFFRCLPEDIFSDFQQRLALKTNEASVDVDQGAIAALMDGRRQGTPEELMIADEARGAIDDALSTLNPREQQALRSLYGLGGDEEKTLGELGEELGCSRERARQITGKALHRLRRPSSGAVALRSALKEFGRDELTY